MERLERLLTAQETAALLQMSVQFVREHADELHAIRMGGGANRAGRLRFTHAGIAQFMKKQSSSVPRSGDEPAAGPQSTRLVG